MGYTPAARIHLGADWLGTAEELAAEATRYLLESGFDSTFACTERTVRYYVTRGVLTAPDKGTADRRKAVFGPRHFRQLVLARLLVGRGWDLDRVTSLIIGQGGPKDERQLDELLNNLATPTPAEIILFGNRQQEPKETLYSSEIAEETVEDSAPRLPRSAERKQPAASKSAGVRERLSKELITRARQENGGLDRLAEIIRRFQQDPELSTPEQQALSELAEMAQLAFRNPSRKERWTRVKLAPWCEINLRVSQAKMPSRSQRDYIVQEFSRLLSDFEPDLDI